ncbi:MAG: hypothetical protein HC820_06245 [Hydrococcus sp. RM1_1_31]|nr:hypothetical protein [Hydrococcus sp. RM1_1_31]
MGNPNFVAGYLMLVFPLTISLALSLKGWQRIAGFAASFLLGMVLYSTSSRGGFLGILVLTLVSGLFFVLRGRGKQRWQRLAGCTAILAVISLILLSHPRVQEIVKIAAPTGNTSAIQTTLDYSTQERLLMLHTSVNILKAKPLFWGWCWQYGTGV